MHPPERGEPELEGGETVKQGGRSRVLDDSLRRLRSRFSRRLESFGLGEGQLPLLTDGINSVDGEGNSR